MAMFMTCSTAVAVAIAPIRPLIAAETLRIRGSRLLVVEQLPFRPC